MKPSRKASGRAVLIRAAGLLALLLTVALALVARPAAAVDGDGLGVIVSQRWFEGSPRRVVAAGPYALVALDSGVGIVDISNPALPTFVSHVPLPGVAHDLAVAGNLIFVADGEAGLAVIDAADPAAARLVAMLPEPGARAIEVANGLVYLGEASDQGVGRNGLRVIDVADPLQPRALGFLATSGAVLDVALDGSLALLGAGGSPGSAGLAVADVSDPDAPLARGFLATGKPINQIALRNGRALLAAGSPSTGALIVADYGPADPVEVTRVPILDGAMGIALSPSGTEAYVAARALGLLAYDVSNPDQPVRVDALDTDRLSVGVASAGGVALLAERSSSGQAGLSVIDAPAGMPLADLALYPYAEATGSGAGTYACLLRRDALWLFDAQNPLDLVPLQPWAPPGADFSSLAVAGNLAAVGEGDVVHLLDLSSGTPVAMGDAVLASGVVFGLALDAGTLYALNGSGLETFSVASPPAPLGALDLGALAGNLVLDGSRGYVVAGDALVVLDLAVGSSPQELGRLSFPGETLYGVAIDPARRLALLTGLDRILYQVDVSDPSLPVLESSLSLPGVVGREVALSGDHAIVAAGRDGVLEIAVSPGQTPLSEGYLDTSGTAWSLAASGGAVYLAALEAQHWVLECQSCTCAYPSPIATNSLRSVKQSATEEVFTWSYAGTAADANLHRTEDPRLLADLWSDPATLVATTAGAPLRDQLVISYSPAPGVCGHYRIFTRGCAGDSVSP